MDSRDAATPDQRLVRAARGAHALSDALWAALHEQLAGSRPRAAHPDDGESERAAELARRLADIGSALALLAEMSEPGGPRTPLEPPGPESPELGIEIEIHDARSEEEPANPPAWIGSIGRRLERHREDRLPFAVLLIEVIDIDRIARAEPGQELTQLTTQVERAIGAELRPADLLAHEALGRYWLVTPETDAPGARQLAERLARAVRLAARHRGVPLEIALGIAVCPEDGQDASVLAAHADVGVYTARAAGRSVAPDDTAA